MPIPQIPGPVVHHTALGTSFCGVEHHLSSPEAKIYQYRGIKYASIPARFRQSKVWTTYPGVTDASRFGPICPQPAGKSYEDEVFGPPPSAVPGYETPRKQSEFECLNLNITCPAGLTQNSKLPVMIWVHGGGDRGSGSSWAYDGGAVIKRSMTLGKPIILVTFNFRIGLVGSAASPHLHADNKNAGDEGVGNYGLHDQRQAMAWVHEFISEFGGSPDNITLFGANTGAADILSHLLSSHNQRSPLFHRAILQSPLIDPCPPSVSHAGSHLSRSLSSLTNGQPLTPDVLRAIPIEDLANITTHVGVARATNDGFWYREGWTDYIAHSAEHGSHLFPPSLSSRRSRSRISAALGQLSHLQPIIIGDSSPSSCSPCHHSSSLHLWTSPLLTRRLKAVCLSISKATRILSAYELDALHHDGPADDTDDEICEDPDELAERVRELVHDARVAWPTDCVASAAVREKRKVWRYIFDEEGTEDARCFFDNCPPVEQPEPMVVDDKPTRFENASMFSLDDDEGFVSGGSSPCNSSVSSFESPDTFDDDDGYWGGDAEDAWGSMGSPYDLVRDALQSRWLAFAYGESPWGQDCVYVFGPEGETGERSNYIFERRRRKNVWKQALEPLGMSLVSKVGHELSRGPSLSPRY